MDNKVENIDSPQMSESSKRKTETMVNEKNQLLLEVEQALANTQQKVDDMMNERRYYIVQLFNKFYQNEDSSFLNTLTDKQYRDIFHGILDNASIESLKSIIKEKAKSDDLNKSWEEIRKQNRESLIYLFTMYYPNEDPNFIRNLTVSQVRDVVMYIENKDKINEIKELALINVERY